MSDLNPPNELISPAQSPIHARASPPPPKSPLSTPHRSPQISPQIRPLLPPRNPPSFHPLLARVRADPKPRSPTPELGEASPLWQTRPPLESRSHNSRLKSLRSHHSEGQAGEERPGRAFRFFQDQLSESGHRLITALPPADAPLPFSRPALAPPSLFAPALASAPGSDRPDSGGEWSRVASADVTPGSPVGGASARSVSARPSSASAAFGSSALARSREVWRASSIGRAGASSAVAKCLRSAVAIRPALAGSVRAGSAWSVGGGRASSGA